MTAPDFDALFAPKAVALVGASPEPTRYGGRVFRLMKAFGFHGELWPVNPKYAEIDGVRCYPSLAALPGRPDHVGIAVSRDRVMATLEECAAAKVPFVTLFTAGYAENGSPEGKEAQDRLVDFVRSHGMRMLGPNCNGVINWRCRLAMTGTSAVTREETRKAGRVAVLSQSGGAGASNVMWRAMQAGLDVNIQASTGNEADLDLLDLALYAIEDPGTDIVMLFAERIADGAKVVRLGQRAAALGKVVLVQKLGRSEAGVRAALSHTGTLSGSDRVHDAAFRQLGLVRVDAPQQLTEAAMLFQMKRPMPAEGIAALSSSGGSVVLAADLGERFGVRFPAYADATRRALGELIPGYINVSNPTDLSPDVLGNTAMFRRTLEILAADPSIGLLMPILTFASEKEIRNLVESLSSLGRPAAIVWTGGATDGPHPTLDRLHDGIPVYRDVDTALRAAGALARHARFTARRRSGDRPERPAGLDRERALALVRSFDGDVLPERIAKQVLAAYGFRVPREIVAATAAEATAAVRKLGGRAVLKIDSPDVPHKTEAGGVRLGVTAEDASRAFDEVLASVSRHVPGARIDGVLVQEQVEPGLEMILGLSTDPVYGPVIAAGIGGILVELLKDSSLRLPPLSRRDADEMLAELAGAPLLGEVRGRAARDREAVLDLVVRLSWLAADLAGEVAEIDVNPLIVHARGAVAADALLVKHRARAASKQGAQP